MNKKQAEEKDLIFTGYYESDQEKINIEIQKLKKDKRFKVYKVWCPASKYSRGYSPGGWSIYATKEYFEIDKMNDLEISVSHYKGQKEALQRKYEKEQLELAEREAKETEELNQLKEKYSK